MLPLPLFLLFTWNFKNILHLEKFQKFRLITFFPLYTAALEKCSFSLVFLCFPYCFRFVIFNLMFHAQNFRRIFFHYFYLPFLMVLFIGALNFSLVFKCSTRITLFWLETIVKCFSVDGVSLQSCHFLLSSYYLKVFRIYEYCRTLRYGLFCLVPEYPGWKRNEIDLLK